MGQIRFLRDKVRNIQHLHIPVVVLDAALAELMQTLTYVLRVIVNCGAYLAEQGLVLNDLEQVRGYNRVVGFVQFAGPGHYVQKIQVCEEYNNWLFSYRRHEI